MVGVAGRSKGCNTCRRRRVKCDEAKPQCYRCVKAGFECLGYERAVQWRHTSLAPLQESRLQMSEYMDYAQPMSIGFAPAQELSLVAFEGDIYTAHMFSNFVWKTYGTLWLDQAAEGRLGNLSLDAVKALAQSSFGLKNRVQDLQLKGAAQYGKCLRVLADELGRDDAAVHDSRRLVVPILVLMMVSAIQSDRTAAVFHLKAIGKVLMLCGPGAFQQQPLRNAFEAARATLLVASLHSRQRTFLEEPGWQDVPYALDPSAKPQQSRLLDIFVMIPGLLEEYDRIDDMALDVSGELFGPYFISNELSNYRNDLCGRVTAQLERLYKWRYDWQRRYGQHVTKGAYRWDSNSPSPKAEDPGSSSPKEPGFLQFDRPVYADDIALYNAALMWLMSLIWKLEPSRAASLIRGCVRRAASASSLPPRSSPSMRIVSFEPLSPPGASFSIRDPAMEICRIYDWQCRNHERHAAFSDQTCMYLFPLGMARTVLDANPECQRWIDSMVDSNAVTAGYGKNGASVVGFRYYVTKPALDPVVQDCEIVA
ncbi:hypothetical protein F5Y04DRAFT_127251 [Hypomontagnella monticulosa]|nr:hypothetical protein F5Y04DRAFT_127251 [Hypomontagnella monticulosa]